MKTIIRKNGQKIMITDALYESIRKKGLMEEEQLSLPLNDDQISSNPSQSQSNPTNPTQPKPFSYQPLLNFDKRYENANEIREALKRLYNTYGMAEIKGMLDHPFCKVYKTDKFQKGFFNKWKKIANILVKRDINNLSDKEIKVLEEIETQTQDKRITQLMIEDLVKLFNLQGQINV